MISEILEVAFMRMTILRPSRSGQFLSTPSIKLTRSLLLAVALFFLVILAHNSANAQGGCGLTATEKMPVPCCNGPFPDVVCEGTNDGSGNFCSQGFGQCSCNGMTFRTASVSPDSTCAPQ